ncbi:MAG: hypothetical protein KC978_10780, partial [Candidatus Omnitrophica bacterium]|nr:hypothetical protein [Candidatus Omnitrophota bacterium]
LVSDLAKSRNHLDELRAKSVSRERMERLYSKVPQLLDEAPPKRIQAILSCLIQKIIWEPTNEKEDQGTLRIAFFGEPDLSPPPDGNGGRIGSLNGQKWSREQDSNLRPADYKSR